MPDIKPVAAFHTTLAEENKQAGQAKTHLEEREAGHLNKKGGLRIS